MHHFRMRMLFSLPSFQGRIFNFCYLISLNLFCFWLFSLYVRNFGCAYFFKVLQSSGPYFHLSFPSPLSLLYHRHL